MTRSFKVDLRCVYIIQKNLWCARSCGTLSVISYNAEREYFIRKTAKFDSNPSMINDNYKCSV